MGKGFTITEIIFAFFLLAAFSAVGYSQYVNASENAKISSVMANMHTVQLCAEDFCTMAEGVYPGGINTRVNQVCPANPSNNSMIAGANRLPFPPEALLPDTFANPINDTLDAIRNGIAKKPSGCIYYAAYDPSGNRVGEGQAAIRYRIQAMGIYRPMLLEMTSGGKEPSK